jgi:hypothetical protein
MDIVSETRLTSSEDGTCLLCDRPFQARRTGGTPKKFCSPAHRNAFHTAARKWAEKAVAGGRITLDDLKADPAACTLISGGISPATAPEAGSEVDALGALLCEILDTLSLDELAELPEPVWSLLEFIAGPDLKEPLDPPAST